MAKSTGKARRQPQHHSHRVSEQKTKNEPAVVEEAREVAAEAVAVAEPRRRRRRRRRR